MSDENKYSISDIVNFASQQNPLEVKNAVDALMFDKIHAAIADKKIEVAKQMFGGEDEPEVDDFEEDEIEQEENESEENVEDSDDDFMDISDDELEQLLNDLEDLDLDLEDDNLDSEENDNGENA